MGVINFGQFPTSANFGQFDFDQFVDVEFWDDQVWGQEVHQRFWASWADAGAQKGGWGAQNFAFFFPSATIVFLLLSWGPCVEFWRSAARFGGAAGVSHDSPRAQKMCTFSAFKNTNKIQRKNPKREKEE